MKHIIHIFCMFLISAFLFCASHSEAFAQDSAGMNYNSESPIYNTGLSFNTDASDGWEHESALYRRWGWSLFGGGLAFAIGGGIMAFSGGMGSALTSIGGGEGYERGIALERMGTAGLSLGIIGAAATFTGIGLLIADAVKFNPYRKASKTVSFMPEIYLTPEMTGLGISGRF